MFGERTDNSSDALTEAPATTGTRRAIGWTALAVFVLLLILVPFALFEERIEHWFAHVRQAGYSWWLTAGIIGGLFVADIFLPVPSTIVNTAAGAMLGLWGGTLVVWAGMSAGCLLGYWVGSRAGPGLAQRLVGEREFARVSQAAQRHGDWVLIVFRAVPVLAEASVLFAGLTRLPLGRFLLLTTAANLGIAAVYAAIGAYSANVQSFLLAFAGALTVPLLMMGTANRWFKAR